ncbi:hypothetical protein HPB47_003674 [Ixodes persulcatus]|uniref:Uncharacterized protein n=1 Tax=Ixodes persulcatus TaxID=34615 RepID=A0AC60PHS7_IXOPE|nr:hypothetical protein HPB47_003674 [Ixodes persulcatus]
MAKLSGRERNRRTPKNPQTKVAAVATTQVQKWTGGGRVQGGWQLPSGRQPDAPPGDSLSFASVAKTAPLVPARPQPSRPILKTLERAVVDICRPPSRRASAPENLLVLRKSRTRGSSGRPPAIGDKRLSPVWIASFESATLACDLVFGVMYPLGPSVPRRNLSDRLNPMELYSDRQFLARYPFTKAMGRELRTLLPLQQSGDNRGLPLTPLLQLLVTLRFYGAGTFQTVKGDLVHVSQPTVCRTVKTVTTLIARVLFRRLVHFSASSEYHGVMRDFNAMGQFPGVTGCIDCTHVRIRSPGGDDAEVYRNRKGVFSLNVQRMCCCRGWSYAIQKGDNCMGRNGLLIRRRGAAAGVGCCVDSEGEQLRGQEKAAEAEGVPLRGWRSKEWSCH